MYYLYLYITLLLLIKNTDISTTALASSWNDVVQSNKFSRADPYFMWSKSELPSQAERKSSEHQPIFARRDAAAEHSNKNLLGLNYEGPAITLHDFRSVDTARYMSLIDSNWEYFKESNSRTFSGDDEETKRRSIWEQNLYIILEHNALYYHGSKTHRLTLNKFADQSMDQLKTERMGFKRWKDVMVTGQKIFDASPELYVSPLEKLRMKGENGDSTEDVLPVPDSVDWRSSGCVTEVKDQGWCAASWAFSATGALESLDCIWNLKKKNESAEVVELSEQNIIDCAAYLGNSGCDGGFTELAFTYVGQNVGISTADCYPYIGITGTECTYDVTCRQTYDLGYYAVEVTDEDSLKYHVAKVGPISVAINADVEDFVFYENGVYNGDCSGDAGDLNHALLVVGYGEDNDSNYWLVKNSWGENWGSNGYMRIARDAGNHCGIVSDATFPAVRGLMDYIKESNLLEPKGDDEL